MVADENYFKQLQSNHTLPTNDADIIDVSRPVQPSDDIVAVPIIPQKNLPLEIRKNLNNDIATADDIIEEIVDDEKYTNQLDPDKSSLASNEEIKNSRPSDPIIAVPNEINKPLIKEVAIAADIIEGIQNDEKRINQPHSGKSSTANNEEKEKEKNSQPSDPITAVSNGIEKELIKDVALATAIIEKIVTNKNYFNYLNEGNNIPFIHTPPKRTPLGLLSKPTTTSEAYIDIEKNLVKDIAVAITIIDQIISNKTETSSPILKHTIITKKQIVKKVRKIISEAIVSPNLIALEKSIKELLSRKNIFTNFKHK